jgi:hypothetical protein
MSQVYMLKNRIARVSLTKRGELEVYTGITFRDGSEQAMPHFRGKDCCKTFKTNKRAMIAVHEFLYGGN